MEYCFFPNSSGDLHSDAHLSQIIRGDADKDHTQIIGEDTVKLLEGIHPPRVSAPLPYQKLTLTYITQCQYQPAVTAWFRRLVIRF